MRQNDLNRWMPLVKWLLAIPHYIMLFFLAIAAFVVIIIAWFAILFTGRYPQGLFDFVVGVMRWGNRVQGYAFILITDRYPPFSLNPVGKQQEYGSRPQFALVVLQREAVLTIAPLDPPHACLIYVCKW